MYNALASLKGTLYFIVLNVFRNAHDRLSFNQFIGIPACS
jgi:hypothetical protein